MELNNNYGAVETILRKKYGITDIDKAYLAIDYSNKTELIDNYGRTVCHTRSYSSLLKFSERVLAEKIP